MAKIMLVEDDPMIAEIYMKKFEVAGFEMVNAQSSKEVLTLAKEQRFDLILLDMVLPEMSGIEVLKELKQGREYDRDTKVVILSNLARSEHEKEAKDNGADGYLEKAHYTPSELVNEVQRLINEFVEKKKNKDRSTGEVVISKKGKRILFIEDEQIFCEMFGKKLEDEGYEIEYANNGAWGSKLAGEKDYDLIITDVVMPAMTGEEIVRRLKLDDRTKDVPVIVLSASLIEEDIQPVRQLGITDFFEKTRVVPSDLARRVQELLS